MKTLKDLFLEEQSYIVNIEINNDFSVYVEGLDNFGLGIFDKNYKVEDIEYFCIEIIFKGEMLKNISKHNIILNATIEDIKTLFWEEMKKGYKVISGLDNVNDFTESQLLEYMKTVLNEEQGE